MLRDSQGHRECCWRWATMMMVQVDVVVAGQSGSGSAGGDRRR